MNDIRNIKIVNCNCIKEGKITIEINTLNIKFGWNGTGKSTISKAVFYKANNDSMGLNLLSPYKINPDDKELQPEVEGMTFSIVRVFDETYVNSYLFKQESFLENSFQVFLRSDECDKLTLDIEKLLEDLQGLFQHTESIQKLKEFLPKYFKIVKYNDNDNKLYERGGVGEFINGNGAGFEQYEELEPYRPFYQDRDFISVSKWAKWRNDGIKQMNGEFCPFCTNRLEIEEIKRQNETITKVFKNSALSTANAVLEFIQEAVELGYITTNSSDVMKSYIGNSSKKDDLTAELQQLAMETDYLSKKIEKICLFRPLNVTHDELSNIEETLDDLSIEKRYLTKFYTTEYILNFIKEINDKILALKENTGKLKGLFAQHEQKINKLILDRRDDINHFLSLAGFPYKFIIKPNGENQAISYLIPVDSNEENRIPDPEKHLSWGEKNAFSLVMFMFQAISDNADLIVLDDPITAFDKNKKFAVVRRLFDNKKASFRERTVIMLTHDLQPIIDYVYGGFFKRYGITTPVKARLLQNENGIIKENDIQSSDLLNIVELTKEIAKDSNKKMAVRVVNLRRHIEIIKPNFSEIPLYEVLSNLIHGRDTALSKKEEKLEPEILRQGCQEMKCYLGDFSYCDILQELTNEKLFEAIKSSDKYEKIICIRLLFERNAGLLLKLRRRYPAACKYVNETNHVENDYIFQLNPFKYFNIPQFYLTQLEEFISSEFV